MGSLAHTDWHAIAVLSLVVVATSWVAWSKREELNLLLLGEDEAKNAGVNTEKLKRTFIIIVALAVGTTVAYCGIIGFIGLAVPHLARLLVGANHKYLLVLTVILSPLILLWADAIARVIIQPSELPIGIITSLMGAPFFLWLLLKNKQTIVS
jgi:iron complex transport system permease protein